MKNKQLFYLLFVLLSQVVSGQPTNQSYWIWYPGDYEIWLHKTVSLRRTEKGAFYPPFYRLDNHYGSINFSKEFVLDKPEDIVIYTTGRNSIKFNSVFLPENTNHITIPEGKNKLEISVVNYDSLPALFITGKTIHSDSSWKVTCWDRKWVQADMGSEAGLDKSPLKFPFIYNRIKPLSSLEKGKGLLIDLGKENFGSLIFNGCSIPGAVSIYYGESQEEALSLSGCETMDRVHIPQSISYTVPGTKGLRYAYIIPDAGTIIQDVAFLEEKSPVVRKGEFRCSNDRLNQIWDVSAYTLELNTREFMLDGIKRDRWIWSGDAVQSFLMNYYIFFDKEVNKRTILGLRGSDPVNTFINHIVDYSMYWFISIYDYYLYTGDKKLIQMLYPKMISMMDFCETRINSNGFIQGKSNDWIYLDWADIEKNGELSAYQILFSKSLESLSQCAILMNDSLHAKRYASKASELRKKSFDVFWDDKKHALVHNRTDNGNSETVTRYSNMFALLFGYLNPQQKEDVSRWVLMNDSIKKITTPYMRFYELAALCEADQHAFVTKEIIDYWGGMLDLGATTFWEVFNPEEKSLEHYAMYGRPFGRSLCHAWGASPIYIFGRYYLGIYPTSPGYANWECSPNLGGLEWIKGKVPTPKGNIDIYMDKKVIRIKSPIPFGRLTFSSEIKPKANFGTVTALGNNKFEIMISQSETEYIVQYQNP